MERERENAARAGPEAGQETLSNVLRYTCRDHLITIEEGERTRWIPNLKQLVR